MGPIETKLNEILKAQLQPTHLEVENESHGHNVPKGSESHFRVVVVSSRFEGLSRVDRQRLVNDAVKGLLAPGGIHALAQKALTPKEFETASPLTTPNCAHAPNKN